MSRSPFSTEVAPDWRGLDACIRREGTPSRVHHIELFLDAEVEDAICERFGVLEGIDPDEKFFGYRRRIALQRFLGYDYVRCSVAGLDLPLKRLSADDTAELAREGGRKYMEEHRGPITSWRFFEQYQWPEPWQADTEALEWFEENLPEDMCVIGSGGFAHFAEHLSWLMGYETLCTSLYDQRDLVEAIAGRLLDLNRRIIELLLQFDRVKFIWGSDDMGFRSGPLISPKDLRQLVFPGHRLMASMSHEADRPYLLHSCGKLDVVMDDLLEDVKIDAKHSFEDTIENVCDAKKTYGDRIALLGGIDVDFLCRADEAAVRARVRETLDACMPGGGYCLGTGNSVANYIPLDNYLAMVDEGRKWGA
jgi:uroporphyrinogen decarboxylase